MKLLHISDTHGIVPTVPLQLVDDFDSIDAIVHSGDFMPNRSRGRVEIEVNFQYSWLRENKAELISFIRSKPFLFVQGNHDFINPCGYMREWGLDARNISGNYTRVGDVGFLGMHLVKYFTGEWANEVSENDIADELARLKNKHWTRGVDVLVTHSPAAGYLDQNAYGEECGSRALLEFLVNIGPKPKLLLHGHIHESGGQMEEFGGGTDLTIVNAATKMMLIEV